MCLPAGKISPFGRNDNMGEASISWLSTQMERTQKINPRSQAHHQGLGEKSLAAAGGYGQICLIHLINHYSLKIDAFFVESN
jgi:hypothetical protein